MTTLTRIRHALRGHTTAGRRAILGETANGRHALALIDGFAEMTDWQWAAIKAAADAWTWHEYDEAVEELCGHPGADHAAARRLAFDVATRRTILSHPVHTYAQLLAQAELAHDDIPAETYDRIMKPVADVLAAR